MTLLWSIHVDTSHPVVRFIPSLAASWEESRKMPVYPSRNNFLPLFSSHFGRNLRLEWREPFSDRQLKANVDIKIVTVMSLPFLCVFRFIHGLCNVLEVPQVRPTMLSESALDRKFCECDHLYCRLLSTETERADVEMLKQFRELSFPIIGLARRISHESHGSIKAIICINPQSHQSLLCGNPIYWSEFIIAQDMDNNNSSSRPMNPWEFGLINFKDLLQGMLRLRFFSKCQLQSI